jgi:hypothetical protein
MHGSRTDQSSAAALQRLLHLYQPHAHRATEVEISSAMAERFTLYGFVCAVGLGTTKLCDFYCRFVGIAMLCGVAETKGEQVSDMYCR